MIPPIDPAKLSPPAQKILTGPPKMQEMAARGIALGVMPAELILLLVALSKGPEPGVAAIADKTLGNLPQPVLAGALGASLAPQAIDALATRYHDQVDMLAKLLAMPGLAIDTVEDVSRVCNEHACELIATNEERLLAHPKIIEYLYLNKNCRMSTADRIIELAVRNNVEVSLPAWKEAAAAIQNELIMEPTGEASPDDLIFRQTTALADQMRQDGESIEDALVEGDDPNVEAKVRDKFVPLFREIAMMTNSQKIRFATIGTPEAILILINDPSPLVSRAAAQSPQMNEAVVEQCAKRRNISGEVLTAIGQKPELLRRLSTKRDLMKNPKTPPSLAMKLINHFQEHELSRMQSDRNVSSSIRALIKNHLERKKR
ncbi:MAG: hypothetical protein HOV80_13925 [Polyangiaceae bacterium]|nr:hypothetical protein [Polyangiaceae bacterium]